MPDPAHDHSHGPGEDLRTLARANRRRLLFVVAAGTLVMIAEIVGGLVANSLVLLADAAHYATDILAVLLAFLAISWAARAATKHKTFGYHRAEVVAAFLNALGLWLVSAALIWGAIRRLNDPPPVEGKIVVIVGAIT